MVSKRWTPVRAAVVAAVAVAVALLAIGLAAGAVTGEYEANGERTGKILIPAMIAGALIAYHVQKSRLDDDRRD